MGSFNDTCCISNIPIEQGTRVKMILLMKKGFDHNYCNIDDFYHFITIPMGAYYDDYGSYVVDNNELNDEMLRIINENITLEKKFKTWTDYFLYTEKDLMIASHNKKVERFIVREDVYNEMIKVEHSHYAYNEKGKFLQFKSDVNFYEKLIENFIYEQREKTPLNNPRSIERFKLHLKLSCYCFDFFREFFTFGNFTDFILDCNEIIEIDLFKRIAEFCVFRNTMLDFNIVIRPTIISGQTTNYKKQCKFYKQLAKICNEEYKKEKEYD